MRFLIVFLSIMFVFGKNYAHHLNTVPVKLNDNTIIYVHTVDYYLNQFKYLSNKQKRIMRKVYNKAKEFDLQNTMTAIAFKESSFGKFLSNDNDGEVLGSYGVFHNLVDSVYDRYIQNKPKNKIGILSLKLKIAKRLKNDFDFSFSQSLAELKFWENYAIVNDNNPNKWKLMVIRYNGGIRGTEKPQSIKYYYEIVNIIKALKIYRKKNAKKYYIIK